MSDIAAIAAPIEAGIRAAVGPVRAVYEQKYLKSELEFLGSQRSVRGLVRAAARANPWLDRTALVALAEHFWAAPIHEYRHAAIEWLVFRQRLLEPGDLALIERLLRESKTWAYVDTLAIHIAGPLIERHPELPAELDRWAADADFWIRRSALLALLLPLRRGGGDFERFARYADAMLAEREFFVRKAIGWVLREVSKQRPALVADWLAPRLDRASGVTVREAVKYLPADRREALLQAYADAGRRHRDHRLTDR